MLKLPPLGRFYDIYICLTPFYQALFVLRDKQLATNLAKNQYILDLFDLPVTSQVKKKINIIVSCRVRRDLSNAV